MKRYPILITLLLFTLFAKAQQQDKPQPDTTQIYTAVQETASFPGGVEKMKQYLAKSVKYNKYNEWYGRVFVTFVVNRDGSLSNFQVLRGHSPETDAEALRVLKASPKWVPGKQNNLIIKQQYTVAIPFIQAENQN